ncbi:hypothetical protein PLICRDRAFT_87752 [Plicaturopsis crispa FD-325 SS-3]|nr:hypothetical protein PLICRDRAFT_87752 [Plicaturopsis crispa FD-325 SS-3]
MFGRFDPFSMYDMGGMGGSRYTFGGDIDRRSFAPVSNRAYQARENAQKLFLDHLATVDTSKGPVTTEIIKFHLVPDMKKSFNKFVKEYGCTATSRKITRAEQDEINKMRKSLMQFTSVRVTPEAQKAYLEKNPSKKGAAANAAASTSSGSTSSAPLKDVTGKKRDANQADLEPSSSSAKKVKM